MKKLVPHGMFILILPGYFFHSELTAPDKRGYQVNIFLIFQQKHMLWILIRNTLARHF